MNDSNIMEIWKSYDDKLQESLQLNRAQTASITQLQVRSLLASMQPLKLLTLVVGIIWVTAGILILGHIYLYAFADANKFFLFAASFQVILTAIAIGFYLHQMDLINSVDVSQSILITQEKIARLQSSTLLVAKILLLQLPAWTIFWWNESLFETWSALQWAISMSITGIFTFISIWLFINIRMENRQQWWFKILFSGKEWEPLLKSMDILSQVEAATK